MPHTKHKEPVVATHHHVHPKNVQKLPGHTKNPLASYCYYPDNVDFIGADKSERIVLLLRRHPITNLKWIITSFVLSLAPLLIGLFPVSAYIPMNYQLIMVLGWYLMILAFVFEEFLGWFFNVYIITDERVFDVDFVNLVYREITDANIDQIQDVTVKVGGVGRTIFDYGDIQIQTAAEIPQLEFEGVPHPDKVAQILRELRVEEEIEKMEGRVR